ncbi:MAG: hypothetical protein JSV49_06535 [Thermoplasmata archaeon]|nr:MAG: hypothetical protein JSV49_06535 [Thermoplasmata archaeon]
MFVRIPKFLTDLVHEVRVLINPRYADEFYDTGILVKGPLEKIEKKFAEWGAELNHTNQFKYPNQVSSAHLYFENGKQLHIRVKYISGAARYELKGHVEWHGVPHPIKHMMYADLDYDLGFKITKELWNAGEKKIEGIKKKYQMM